MARKLHGIAPHGASKQKVCVAFAIDTLRDYTFALRGHTLRFGSNS